MTTSLDSFKARRTLDVGRTSSVHHSLPEIAKRVPVCNRNHDLGHGGVVVAAITSCGDRSDPSVMIAAGLLAFHELDEAPGLIAMAGEGLACPSSEEYRLEPQHVRFMSGSWVRDAAIAGPIVQTVQPFWPQKDTWYGGKP